MSDVSNEAARRRTFAIISHPDAGKTTLTEKLLLFGGAIQMAGSVKGRKAARHATSDWMALEKERGISVTSSVMQFPYEGRIVRLLDTPIMTFVNKLDREGKDPIDLLDEIESVLGIQCAPVTWPIGMGSRLKGVCLLYTSP